MSDEAALIPLSQGAGYGVLIGFGFLFGVGMIGVTKFLDKFMGERSDHSEMLVQIFLKSNDFWITEVLTNNS